MTAPDFAHHRFSNCPARFQRAALWVAIAAGGMLAAAGVQANDAPPLIEPAAASGSATNAPSLLATHSHLRFSISSGARACDALATSPAAVAATPVAASTAECLAAHKDFAQRLARIVAPLIRAAQTLELNREAGGRQFEVYVADGMTGGSASSGAGHIAIASELASLQPTDDFLAFVLAREIAHVSLAHHEDNSAASLLASAAVTLFFPAVGIIKTAISLASSQLAANSRNRSQRAAADELAQRLLDAAGHSRRGLALNLASVSLQPLGGSAWAQTLSASMAPLLGNVPLTTAETPSVRTPQTATAVTPNTTTPPAALGTPLSPASSANPGAELARLLAEADAVVFRNGGQTRR